MKTATQRAAQGDCLFRRVTAVPKEAIKQKRKGVLIVAHSETGHHHTIDDSRVGYYEVPGNPLVAYLQLGDCDEIGGVDVVHQRNFDKHETLRLLGAPGDVWEVRRQREWTPEGWMRVLD
jgi:hypothetical protein